MNKDRKLTTDTTRILKRELLDERRIGLVTRAFNVALLNAGLGSIKARLSESVDGDCLAFDLWKVDNSKSHLV